MRRMSCGRRCRLHARRRKVTLGQQRRGEGEYREALGVIAKQTSRLTRLVDDMLVLARADSGGYPMVAAQVRLDQLVAECVREFGAPAEDRNIALHATVKAADTDRR